MEQSPYSNPKNIIEKTTNEFPEERKVATKTKKANRKDKTATKKNKKNKKNTEKK